jgi:hypothetical protein
MCNEAWSKLGEKEINLLISAISVQREPKDANCHDNANRREPASGEKSCFGNYKTGASRTE